MLTALITTWCHNKDAAFIKCVKKKHTQKKAININALCENAAEEDVRDGSLFIQKIIRKSLSTQTIV